MKVEYIDHMGSDLSVVNAARVSFDKESSWESAPSSESDLLNGAVTCTKLRDSDAKLIKYLAAHNHWSPFAHNTISLRWKAPIFVARQLAKHQVGFAWNEISRRYVKTSPKLWFPKTYRKAAENVKQGSSEEPFELFSITQSLEYTAEKLVTIYNHAIEMGLCPEQARMFLPQNLYTEWIWTGSLYGWARVFNQRTDPTAQKETSDLVLTLDEICGKLFPVSWEALTKES